MGLEPPPEEEVLPYARWPSAPIRVRIKALGADHTPWGSGLSWFSPPSKCALSPSSTGTFALVGTVLGQMELEWTPRAGQVHAGTDPASPSEPRLFPVHCLCVLTVNSYPRCSRGKGQTKLRIYFLWVWVPTFKQSSFASVVGAGTMVQAGHMVVWSRQASLSPRPLPKHPRFYACPQASSACCAPEAGPVSLAGSVPAPCSLSRTTLSTSLCPSGKVPRAGERSRHSAQAGTTAGQSQEISQSPSSSGCFLCLVQTISKPTCSL